MVLGQSLFIQAMKRGEASLVMPAFYFVLVFAALYDFALFGVWPSDDHLQRSFSQPCEAMTP
ncbi:hypothetical protein [Aliiroseovarius halocynthiae]|uniref:Uncharacterized protein n=1 Tax=Aliiroseovarius halocynthiae TaxID=985055 RepID=A0A545SND3_9RHOB|nr:hypothetical protein FIL88_14010 [Aliiroseovarius halocynthiae]